MPMSTSRIAALGASLVCSVESTRWPVSAASMAMCALSRSRISPTMIMSGSARTIARSPVANVIPVRSETWICSTPARRYSTGSSIVISVFSGERTRRDHRVERGRLARARRAGHEDAAVRTPQREARRSRSSLGHPEVVERERCASRVEDPQDGGLAGDERDDGHADVDAAAVDHDPDAAVLRQALLGDVQVGEDLDARDHGRRLAARDTGGVAHHAVDAEAHARARLRRGRSGCPRRRARRRRR